MTYQEIATKLELTEGVTQSTMMKVPCLRYNGDFIGMMYDKEDALIIKVSQERVGELISEGLGRAFILGKKSFKEWVLIPLEFEDRYEALMMEALDFASK